MSYLESLDQELDKQLIDIKDYGMRHRFLISDKEPSEITLVKKLNNERYEKFYNEYLLPHSTNGKILLMDANLLWWLYEDMREIPTYKTYIDKMNTPNKEYAEFWLNEFKKPIEELYYYGVSTATAALGLVLDYTRDWYFHQKYNRIYSKGNNFEEWLNIAKNHRRLMEGKERPYNIDEIKEKVRLIITFKT